MRDTITAGDSLNFPALATGYSAADGWALAYRLVARAAGGATIDVGTVADGAAFRVQAAANATKDYPPGDYGWAAYVTRATESYTVGSGQVTVLPNPRTMAPGTDTRSQGQRALDDCRAAFANYTPTVKSYVINGREKVFNSAAEILVVLRYWEAQVAEENRLSGRAEKIARRIYSRI